MTILMESETEVDFDFDYEKVAKDVVNTALDYMKFPFETEVSITLTDNDGIQVINKEFRGFDE